MTDVLLESTSAPMQGDYEHGGDQQINQAHNHRRGRR